MAKKAKKGGKRRRSRVNGLNASGITGTLMSAVAGGVGILAAAYVKDKVTFLNDPKNALIAGGAIAVGGALVAGMVGNGLLKSVGTGMAAAGATIAVASLIPDKADGTPMVPGLYGTGNGIGYLPSPNPWENRSRSVAGIKLQ